MNMSVNMKVLKKKPKNNWNPIYLLWKSIIYEGNPNANDKKLIIDYFELLYNTNDINKIVSSIGEETFAMMKMVTK